GSSFEVRVRSGVGIKIEVRVGLEVRFRVRVGVQDKIEVGSWGQSPVSGHCRVLGSRLGSKSGLRSWLNLGSGSRKGWILDLELNLGVVLGFKVGCGRGYLEFGVLSRGCVAIGSRFGIVSRVCVRLRVETWIKV
ncbi:hypothetical protein HAX54_047945, partial [Datura stramonium]|nr:hypothetical protein [Datura stramonium]